MPALKFASQVDHMKIPILGLVPETNASTSRPSSPATGQLFVNQTTGRLEVYESGAWQQCSANGVELLANKGAASGYAPLDSGALVPLANLPVAGSGSSSATQVVRADDTRLSNSRSPSGSASGDLSGSYPNPVIAALAVTDSKVAAANKDGSVGTPSMRTLGSGALQALAGNTRLDQIALPTASVAFNNQLLTGVGTPVSPSDAANKAYVDGIAQSLDIKASVRVATTADVNGSYSNTGGTSGRGQFTTAPNVIDGVTLAAGDRVLVKDQSVASSNGIWVVTTVGTGVNGVWDRAVDFDSNTDVTPGAFTFVEEGTANGDSGWVLTANAPITLGTALGSNLPFTQFSGAGSIAGGAGLVKNGATLDVVGTANRIVANADSIDIAATYVGQTSITTLGTIATGTWQGTAVGLAYGGTGATSAAAARANLGASGKYAATLAALTAGSELTIAHNLNSLDVSPRFRDSSQNAEILFYWRVIDANTIGVTADVAFAASAVKVVVLG